MITRKSVTLEYHNKDWCTVWVNDREAQTFGSENDAYQFCLGVVFALGGEWEKTLNGENTMWEKAVKS